MVLRIRRPCPVTLNFFLFFLHGFIFSLPGSSDDVEMALCRIISPAASELKLRKRVRWNREGTSFKEGVETKQEVLEILDIPEIPPSHHENIAQQSSHMFIDVQLLHDDCFPSGLLPTTTIVSYLAWMYDYFNGQIDYWVDREEEHKRLCPSIGCYLGRPHYLESRVLCSSCPNYGY